MVHNMKTVSITIGESLLKAVDRAAKASRRTRSDLCRLALSQWLAASRRGQLVREDREGYMRQPVQTDEFEDLLASQPFLNDSEETDL